MTMMKYGIIAGVAGLALASVAWAGSMDGRFGNTVVSKSSNGVVTKVFYDKPGTFTATVEEPGKAKVTAKGKWRLDGGNVCLTSETTFAVFEANKERCVPLNGDKVGDKWKTSGKDAAGNDVVSEVEIVAGR